mmetsp:Transcript_58523/g.96923  ORF Transcript_58523/g.96923 Transcript_58523/m.96923 type:complete len:290 (+) Transcript_58523:32-901(+)
MGCAIHCVLHCLKRCGCCICGCCYSPALVKGFCTHHQTEDNKTIFNSPFNLILYDKWCKEGEVYQQREAVFDQLSNIVIPNKNLVQERRVMDVGCGTGAFTEMLCKTFMLSGSDALILCDTSSQALHWMRTRVIERMDTSLMGQYRVEYYNNDNNKLCLESNYEHNEIDIAFMSFALNHMSVQTGDRHCMLTEIYSYCKPGASFIVIEHGTKFLAPFKDDVGKQPINNPTDDQELLTADTVVDVNLGFASCDALVQFVEGFGFKLETRVMESTFDDQQWILVFKKPKDE